jgi:hypothetical protein
MQPSPMVPSHLPRAGQSTYTDDEPYPEWAPLAAGAAVVIVPFISLIAALLMRSSERGERKREFLKNWAIASGAWLCTGFILIIVVFASVLSSIPSVGGGGDCKGGPDPFAIPTFIQMSGSRHSTAIVPCVNGGTLTRPARPGENPFG